MDPKVSIVMMLNFVNVNLDLVAPNVAIAFQNQLDHFVKKDSAILLCFVQTEDQKVDSDTLKKSILIFQAKDMKAEGPSA